MLKNNYLKPGRNFHNVIYSFSGKAISAIALVALDVLLARMLGASEYAEWAYFFSILNICFFVGWAGINSSTKVIIAHCETKQERADCITTGVKLRLYFAVGIALVISLLLTISSQRLGYPEKYSHLRVLLMLSFFMIICNSFSDFYKSLFTGLNEFKYVFIITICEYVFYFAFCLIFLIINSAVVSVAYGYITAGVLISILGIVLIRRCYPVFSKFSLIAKREYAIQILKRAVPMFVVGIGAVILIELDTFMLGLLSNKTEVAVYSIAKNLTNKAGHVNISLSTGVMTSFAIIAENEVDGKLRKFFIYSVVNVVVAMMISICILIFSPFIIKIMYGSEYLDAIDVFKLLTIFYIMNAVSVFYAGFLDFRGKTYVRSIIYIVVILLDIIMNFFLIPNMGSRGAAIATEVSMLPYVIVTVVFSYKEIMNIKATREKRNA